MSGKVSAEAEPRDNRKKTTSTRHVASAKTKIVRRVDESGYGARHPIIPVLPGPVETEWAETRLDAVCERINIPIDMAELSGREWLHYSIPALEETGGPLIQDGDSIDSSKLVVQSGDVLISKLNPRKSRVTTVSDIEALRTIASTEFVALRPRMVENGFLSWLLQSEPVRALLASRVESATRSHQRVNPDDITKLRARLPAAVDQTRIANFLDEKTARIDALIGEKEGLLYSVSELFKARLGTAVVEGLRDGARLTPAARKGFEAVREDWELIPIKHIVTAGGGMTPSKDKAEFWDGEIPWVSPKDMKRFVLHDSEDHITDEAVRSTSLRLYPIDSVLVVVRGMILAHTFPVALNAIPVTINQDMKALRTNARMSPKYLAWMLRGLAPLMLSLTEESAHGTKALRTDQWATQHVPVPPCDEQAALVSQFEEWEQEAIELRAHLEEHVALLREYRASLISAAVTGQLDIDNYGNGG